jgi:hypothetical protein
VGAADGGCDLDPDTADHYIPDGAEILYPGNRAFRTKGIGYGTGKM